MRFENKNDNFYTIDVKRFYIPVVFVATCPKCGEEVRRDLNDWYLSYPPVGKPFVLDLACGECSYEWGEEIRLLISLEICSKEEES